jgi:hypothetical protein
VHGTGVYSAGVGPKGPALERFLDIKKKKKRVFLNLCLNLSETILFIDVIRSSEFITCFHL